MSENNENKFNKVKYINNYIKENYDRYNLKLQKGKKKDIESHLADFGYKSMNKFINDAIDEKIARDLENF